MKTAAGAGDPSRIGGIVNGIMMASGRSCIGTFSPGLSPSFTRVGGIDARKKTSVRR
jgi:hypothetical protein